MIFQLSTYGTFVNKTIQSLQNFYRTGALLIQFLEQQVYFFRLVLSGNPSSCIYLKILNALLLCQLFELKLNGLEFHFWNNRCSLSNIDWCSDHSSRAIYLLFKHHNSSQHKKQHRCTVFFVVFFSPAFRESFKLSSFGTTDQSFNRPGSTVRWQDFWLV